MADRVVNTMVLVVRRYIRYLRCRLYFSLEWSHLTECISFVLIICSGINNTLQCGSTGFNKVGLFQSSFDDVLHMEHSDSILVAILETRNVFKKKTGRRLIGVEDYSKERDMIFTIE